MARDLYDLAASIHATGDAIPDAAYAGVNKAAKFTKTTILSEVKIKLPDLTMRGVKNGKGKLGVGYEFHGKGTVDVRAEIKSRGFAWKWWEFGTKPHPVPRLGKRKKGRPVFDGNDGRGTHPYAQTMRSGGSPAHHSWKKGVRKAELLTPALFQAEVRKTVMKAWGM